MRCDEVDLLLDEYVDGTLAAGVAREVTDHLAACAACRRGEARSRALVRRTRDLPRSIEPRRDLWDGIEASIRTGDSEATTTGRRRAGLTGPWSRLALAAATLVLVAGTALLVGLRLGRSTAGKGTAPSGPGVAAAVAGLDLEQVGCEYDRARGQLLAVLDARRGSLTPATVEVVERNMRVIDHAVRDIRAALAESPGDQALGQLLLATYRREIDLLQQVTRLPGRA
jgi:anti-sigma-K factor RskA